MLPGDNINDSLKARQLCLSAGAWDMTGGPNGEFVVNPEQAKVVKTMFAMAVLGITTPGIKKKLNDLKISTSKGIYGVVHLASKICS